MSDTGTGNRKSSAGHAPDSPVSQSLDFTKLLGTQRLSCLSRADKRIPEELAGARTQVTKPVPPTSLATALILQVKTNLDACSSLVT